MVQANASRKKQMEIINNQKKKLHIMNIVYTGQRKFMDAQRKLIKNHQQSKLEKPIVLPTKE